MTDYTPLQHLIDDVKLCESVRLVTDNDMHFEPSCMTNILNKNATTLELFFINNFTRVTEPEQTNFPNCTLVYSNNETGHTLLLYGQICVINDMDLRRKYWRAEFTDFGYNNPDDTDFKLLKFVPNTTNFYLHSTAK